jgi:hypothetical protein
MIPKALIGNVTILIYVCYLETSEDRRFIIDLSTPLAVQIELGCMLLKSLVI